MRFVGVPAGGGLGEWRRWLGEGRQVVGRLCEEVERLPARSIEEWRAEEPDSFGMGLSAEMVRAVAFTHCFGSNGNCGGGGGLFSAPCWEVSAPLLVLTICIIVSIHSVRDA